MFSLSGIASALSEIEKSDKPKRVGHGFRYEEQMMALVFARCLKKRLPGFELACENEAWPRFGNVVVTWLSSRDNGRHMLLVQLVHKVSKKCKTLNKARLFPENINKAERKHKSSKYPFAIRHYWEPFGTFRDELKNSFQHFSLALATNIPLHENARDFLGGMESDSVAVPGSNTVEREKLLDLGGDVYKLKAHETVLKTVEADLELMENFFLYCQPKTEDEIKEIIRNELVYVLGNPHQEETRRATEELCDCMQKWKDGSCKNPEKLNKEWPAWKKIENKYKSS